MDTPELPDDGMEWADFGMPLDDALLAELRRFPAVLAELKAEERKRMVKWAQPDEEASLSARSQEDEEGDKIVITVDPFDWTAIDKDYSSRGL
jgi:hypothetical protein